MSESSRETVEGEALAEDLKRGDEAFKPQNEGAYLGNAFEPYFSEEHVEEYCPTLDAVIS